MAQRPRASQPSASPARSSSQQRLLGLLCEGGGLGEGVLYCSTIKSALATGCGWHLSVKCQACGVHKGDLYHPHVVPPRRKRNLHKLKVSTTQALSSLHPSFPPPFSLSLFLPRSFSHLLYPSSLPQPMISQLGAKVQASIRESASKCASSQRDR